MSKEEYSTSNLPQLLKELDAMLKTGMTGDHSLTAAEYIQISLQLKTCQLLNEIKQELELSRKQR